MSLREMGTGSRGGSRMLSIIGSSQPYHDPGSDEGSEEGAVTPLPQERGSAFSVSGSANPASSAAAEMKDAHQLQDPSKPGAARSSEGLAVRKHELNAQGAPNRLPAPQTPRRSADSRNLGEGQNRDVEETPLNAAPSEHSSGLTGIDTARSAPLSSRMENRYGDSREDRERSVRNAEQQSEADSLTGHASGSRRDPRGEEHSYHRPRREASPSPAAYSRHSRGEARGSEHGGRERQDRYRGDRWSPERERHRDGRFESSSHRRREDDERTEHARRRDRFGPSDAESSHRTDRHAADQSHARARMENDAHLHHRSYHRADRHEREVHGKTWERDDPRERDRRRERDYIGHQEERGERHRGGTGFDSDRSLQYDRGSRLERDASKRRSRSPYYPHDTDTFGRRASRSPRFHNDHTNGSRRQEQRQRTPLREAHPDAASSDQRQQSRDIRSGVRGADRRGGDLDSSRTRAERRQQSPERTLSRKASSVSLKAKASFQDSGHSAGAGQDREFAPATAVVDADPEPNEPAPPATPPPPSEQPPPPELLPAPPPPAGLVDEDGDVKMRDASAMPSILAGGRSVGARTSGWRTGAHTSITNASSMGSCSPAFFSGDVSLAHTKDEDVEFGPPTVSRRAQRRSRAKPVPLEHRTFKGCSPIDMYDVGQKLGQGTFGVVERAKHKVTGNDVALKRVTIHDEKDGFPLTAIREIKLLKRLSHPAIVPVIDMAYRRFSDRRPREIYMIEPYMDHDLNGMLENPSIAFTPSQMKLYMKQLLEGTLYMHQNKILHRDMKAANLLINNQGQLQIADFGLARPFRDPGQAWRRGGWKGGDAAQAYTEMVVTRWYRPPELLAGERKYGPPIDMWGLGCILAEMVIKGPLFKGTSEINQLELISQLCGSPNEKNYPGWNSLPGVRNARADGRPSSDEEPGRHDFGNHPRRVIEHFTQGPVNVRRELADLIDKLLVLDPRKRMTAEEALQHEWFWQTPYPALPTSLPRYEASKEIDRQQLREGRKRQHAPPARQPQPVPAMLPAMLPAMPQAAIPRAGIGGPTSIGFGESAPRLQHVPQGQIPVPAGMGHWNHSGPMQHGSAMRAGAGAFMGMTNGNGSMHPAGPLPGQMQGHYPQARGPPAPTHAFVQGGLAPGPPGFAHDPAHPQYQARAGLHPSRGFANVGPLDAQLAPHQPPPAGRQRPQAYDYEY